VKRTWLAGLAASALLLAGCGGSAVNLTAVSRHETVWLRNHPGAHIASGVQARQLSGRISAEVRSTGARLVRLRIYAFPVLAPSAIVVTMRPAHFLEDSIESVFESYSHSSYSHLLVLDPLGRLVFESFQRPDGGTDYVAHGYNGCGSIDYGLAAHSCRGDAWPFG